MIQLPPTFHQFGYRDVTMDECMAVCEEFTGQKGLDIITLHDFKGKKSNT